MKVTPPVRFTCVHLRLVLKPEISVLFAQQATSNLFRGLLGSALYRHDFALYRRIFAPERPPGNGPSGFRQPPRPFVLRTSHLQGQTIAAGQAFHVDLHLFESGIADALTQSFAPALEERFHARLAGVEQSAVEVPLVLRNEPTERVNVRFVTATELKQDGKIVRSPEFPILFSRACDRIRMITQLYGRTNLEADFPSLAEAARRVAMTSRELVWERAERRSGSTGRTHPLGGFRGEATYEGELGELLPWLLAAQWCGVGRQTVWGKGELLVRL